MEWTEELQRANKDEWRAAAHIARALRVLPQLEDDNSQPGMVDLVLEDADGRLEIIEVTSTIDGSFAEAQRIVGAYLDKVEELYDGRGRWILGFGRNWKPLRKSPRDPGALVEVMKQIEADVDGRISQGNSQSFTASQDLGFTDLTLSLFSYPSDTPSIDYSLNAKSSFKGAFAFALQDYLHRDEVIAGKVRKLKREAGRLSAARCHLYLLVAAVGEKGHLLPIRSASQPWGQIELPDGINVLWLDGGTGETARFDRESGWAFF